VPSSTSTSSRVSRYRFIVASGLLQRPFVASHPHAVGPT